MMSARVLLVDDEEAFLSTMQKRMTRRNLAVTAAPSGKLALEALEENSFDVVILDVKMPGMDGIETLRAIKARHPLVEVIMLTGHATVQSAIDGMKLGALDYLMKPCDLEDLLAKVGDAAGKKMGHEQKIAEARAREIANRRGD